MYYLIIYQIKIHKMIYYVIFEQTRKIWIKKELYFESYEFSNFQLFSLIFLNFYEFILIKKIFYFLFFKCTLTRQLTWRACLQVATWRWVCVSRGADVARDYHASLALSAHNGPKLIE